MSRYSLNNITYVEPKVPSLYTALSVGKAATNPDVYGKHANAQVINYNDIVEVVVKNHDAGAHPIHMHGHNFQMVERSGPRAAAYSGTSNGAPKTPMRRDTMKVNGNGYLVYRFKADNPDKCPSPLCSETALLTIAARVWAFHCHIDWHLTAGFFATIVEAPLQLQSQSVPPDQFKVCKDQNLPYQGNAAGNTQNFSDLTGANDAPPVSNRGYGPFPSLPSHILTFSSALITY